MASPLLREEIDVAAADEAEADRLRLRRVELAFARLGELLCERRALRSAGLDPDAARLRPVEVAERYCR